MTPDEFTKVYEVNGPWLVRVATRELRRAGLQDDAEDVVQTVFADFVKDARYAALDPEYGKRLLTIAVRCRVRDLTKMELGREKSDGFTREGRRVLAMAYATIRGAETHAPDALEDAVDAVLGELSEEQRTVATRYWVEGDGMRTIAMELGVSPRSGWRLLSSAREVLEDRLRTFVSRPASSKGRDSETPRDLAGLQDTTAATVRQRIAGWRARRLNVSDYSGVRQ